MPVAAVAALAAGGAVFAASASATAAGTQPHLTVSAPGSVANDGSSGPNQIVTLEINNSAAGNQAIGDTTGAVSEVATLTLTIAAPAGVLCSNINLTYDHSTPGAAPPPVFVSSGTSGTCTLTDAAYTQPQNSDYTFYYQETVDSVGSSTPTGTITTTAVLRQVDTTISNSNTNTTTSTSNTVTTQLASPASATFAAAPPSAIIYQPYSYTLVTSAGTPTTTDYYAFCAPTSKNSSGTYDSGFTRWPNGSGLIYLNDGFYFDTNTGKIVNSGNEGSTDSTPSCAWTIVANNGKGGATTASPGNAGGNTAQPTPGFALHDVDSPQFTLPVLFRDVPLSNTFAPEIYQLADDGDISGYADGTFRGSSNISRQAFATILEGDRGTCSSNHPSPFSDVPSTSPFCRPIRDLFNDGIIGGYSDGTFHPTAPITRQAIAAFLYRANAVWNLHSLPGDALCTTPTPFNDVTSSNPFCGDIEWAAANHITGGYSDGGFHPTANSSRQATAAFIARFNNLT